MLEAQECLDCMAAAAEDQMRMLNAAHQARALAPGLNHEDSQPLWRTHRSIRLESGGVLNHRTLDFDRDIRRDERMTSNVPSTAGQLAQIVPALRTSCFPKARRHHCSCLWRIY